MKQLVTTWILATSLAVIIGCNASSPGGPGVSATPNASGVSNTTITTYKPTLGEADDSFRLSGPTIALHIVQGETASVTITIARGKNFQDDVRLKVAALPGGVTVETTNPMIDHSKGDTTLEFAATAQALPGTYTVTIIGQPTSGPDAKSDFQICVDQR
jgi:hypothetical protein